MSRLRDAWWAAAFLRDVAAGERPTLFKRMGRTPVVTSHVTDEPGRAPVAFDLYITPSRRLGLRPALVVTHADRVRPTANKANLETTRIIPPM